MERRLDELPPRVTRPIHASRCLCDEVGTLIVFVEGQHKVISWITVLGTESIDPLNGFEKDLRVEAIRVVPVRWSSLPDPNVEHKTVEFADLIEHTVCELPEFSILSDVVYRIETRPLLLPHGRMCPRAFDLEVKKLAFALEEPRSESADFCRRQDVSGETEHRTVVVPQIFSTDVRTYVPEFVEIGDVCQSQSPDTRKPAPERGPRKEGNARLRLTKNPTVTSLECQAPALSNER